MDVERRAGLFVMTWGTRKGWLVSEAFSVAIVSEHRTSLMRPISWLE